MKKFILPLALGAVVALSSCGDGGGEESEAEEGDSTVVASTEVDLTGLREFDMSPYDLNVILYIPEKYYHDVEEQVDKFVQPVITHNEGEALWDITMPGDKNFHMIIEDWGDIEQTIAMEKQAHKDQGDIYEFVYNEEGDDYMLFSRVLKSDNTTLDPEDVKSLPNHHFYVVKQIDGYYITAKSYTMQDYYQVSARTMMNCARGMKSAKAN
ncbi:hypothetical protein [Parvicella tangerina]|uniref:Uncharacterized protein n=1 Tax=Parvicella tangerina TaxID=2829795 RepID=A0A916JIL1_9FLAO|nr:hypothetical protein [Parvicella tangerina]CAG5076296.1 hypothetical protein CRYO30217_00052 [Parvicella tangerina]